MVGYTPAKYEMSLFETSALELHSFESMGVIFLFPSSPSHHLDGNLFVWNDLGRSVWPNVRSFDEEFR